MHPILPRCRYKGTHPTATGETAVLLPQGKSPPTGGYHQALQISALALPHSKFPANPEKREGYPKHLPLAYSGSCTDQRTAKTTSTATRKRSEAEEQANSAIAGRDAGQIHNRTPSHHQDQPNKHTFEPRWLTPSGQDPSLAAPSSTSGACLMC